ncbi:MAG: hypothetical protein ACTSQE_13345 [Candidatus Heimdallarchaeaceae archaeon]
MARKDQKGIRMTEEAEIPDLPEIFRHNEKKEKQKELEVQVPEIYTEEEVKEEQEQKEEHRKIKAFRQNLQKLKREIEKTLNIDLYRPEIEKRIEGMLKKGRTLIIGKKIGQFAEQLVEKGYTVIARESSITYVSPKTEVNNIEILEKLDLKPFVQHKLKKIDGSFVNIILLFALKGREYKENYELVSLCRDKLHPNGIMIIVDQFVSRKNVIISFFKLVYFGLKLGIEKLRKRAYIIPIIKLDKIIKQLELRKYKTFEDAGGQIRTYIVAKRLGAFLR